MKNLFGFCMVVLIFLLSGTGNVVLGQSPVTTSLNSIEMPAAIKNMQGTPGYESEVKKWEASNRITPESQQKESQTKVAELQRAQLSAPKQPIQTKSASENTPYHQYKGIADPEQAKAAWAKDQAVKEGK